MTTRWGMGLVVIAVLAVSGCAGSHSAAPPSRPRASASAAPPYDRALPPAQAVLALVPRAATTLSLTDFDQVRANAGAEPGAAGFWQQAVKQAPLLSTNMLRPYAGQIHGFTPDDVAWEAHYLGGGRDGWILGFTPETDMGAVQKAVDDGVGPLGGAVVAAADHVVTSDRLEPTDPRWTDLAELIGPEAEATYVARGCLPGDSQGQRLQPLSAYAISFGQTVATARLGPGRTDLFTRLRLGDAVPAFRADFVHGAADPSTGRIGFTMTDPVDAAQQVLRHKLPFAVCAT